jgi:hypothetical protein
MACLASGRRMERLSEKMMRKPQFEWAVEIELRRLRSSISTVSYSPALISWLSSWRRASLVLAVFLARRGKMDA